MAHTIATAIGHDKNRDKSETRLGSIAATGKAATWRTFGQVYIRADGSGFVLIERDGGRLHTFEFGPEGDGMAPALRTRDQA